MPAQQLRFYFGNIHAHTAFSDGNKDSVTTLINNPAESYEYAKLSRDFDFLGISEHNHYSSARNPGFRRPLYQQGLQMADAANEENNFLCLFGMEYGVSSEYNGHVLVYGIDKLLGWESNVPGVTGNNYDEFNAKSDYAGLFSKVNKKAGAFAWLAHPGFDDYASDGTYKTALANAPYNASFDSAIVGMPLRSGLANNADDTYDQYPLGHYFNYYKKMLYNGYHLGIGYDHDNHYSNFGRGNGGRLVILAPALTRQHFYEAIHARRFYGSDDSNAEVMFTCNNMVMGSRFTGEEYPTLIVEHYDPDGESADSIKIWKGYKNSGGLWAWIVQYNTGNNTLSFTDYDVQLGREYYYFAELRQKDGQWIVTSPVWYSPAGTVAIKKELISSMSLFYDRTAEKLYYSQPESKRIQFKLYDLSGRKLKEETTSTSSGYIDLSLLPTGVFLVSVHSEELLQRTQRFVKE